MTTPVRPVPITARASHRLELLGGAVLVNANGRSHLERKTAGVVALLALEGELTRSRVAGLLWADTDEERARANLRQCLHRLKKLAGAELVRADERLALTGEVEVDATTLESHAFLGDDAGLLELRGELLEGLDYEDCQEFTEWLNAQRERWRGLRVGAYRRALRDPGASGALERAQEWIRLEGLSEEAHRALARAQHARHDRAAALNTLRDLEVVLQRELGTAPSAETRALRESLERSDTAVNLEVGGVAPVPSALSRPPRLIGREREWAIMQRAWDASQAIIVSGAPGVGKTRLLEDFLAAHGGGTRFEGRPGDSLNPYSTHARTYRQVLERFQPRLEGWVRAELARILPELGSSAPPMQSDVDKLRFVQAKAWVTRQAVQLGMRAIAVDDLQFVDAASLEAGYQVYSEHWGQPSGMRTLIAYREGELPESAQAMLEATVKAGLAVRVRLEPLPEASMRALLDSLPITDDLKQRSLRIAAGNPLYALEVARDGVTSGSVPKRVADLTRERLERLSGDAQRLAQVAAVAGTDFSLELASSVLETNPLDLGAALTELEEAQVMTAERFQHDLVHEAVLNGVSAGLKRFLHRRCALALEATDNDPARVAQHWLEGGEERRAIPWWLRAADAAHRRYRLQEASEFAERAGYALERAGDVDAAFDALERAVTYRVSFDLTQHLEGLVETLFGLARVDAQRVRAWLARVRLLNAWQFAPEAEDAARQGLKLESSAEPLVSADLHAGLAEALWRQAQHTAAIAALQPALERYAAIGDTRNLAQAEGRLGIIHGDSEDHDAARAHLERSVALLEKIGDDFAVAKSRNMLGITLGRIGLVRDALEQHQLVRAACERIQGADVLRRMNLSNMGQRFFDLDRYGESLEVTQWALDSLQPELGWARAYSQTHQVRVKLRLGALEALPALLQTILEVPGLRDDMRFDALLLSARLHHTLGTLETARADFAEVRALLRPDSRPFSRIELDIAHSLVATPDEALEWSRDALNLASRHRLNGLRIGALTRLAQTLRGTGRLEEALRHVSEASQLLETYDCTNFYRAEVWWTHADLSRALETPDAVEHLRRVTRWVLETARDNVPPEYRNAFLQVNPVNRAILESARAAGLEVNASLST
jgi:DNA-binding SARP family transcriptional activator